MHNNCVSVRKNGKYSSNKLNCAIAGLFFFLPHFLKAQQIDSFGVISVCMIINIPSPDSLVLDSIMWRQLPLLEKKYQGKKIKKILFQRTTNRVVVFVKGDKLAVMNKEEAIGLGLMAEEKTDSVVTYNTIQEDIPQLIQVDIDSPLYVGITNRIKPEGINLNDFYIDPLTNANVRKSDIEGEYVAQFSFPWDWSLFFYSKKNNRVAYSYNYKIKRLPEDELPEEPKIMIGNFGDQTIDLESLKKQKEIETTEGFIFQSASVYFSGESFKNVLHTNINNSSLSSLQSLIQRCTSGSYITFDNIRVKSASGKLYTIASATFTVL